MKKILVPYDFSKTQLVNALFHMSASDPATPAEAQFYYNSTAKRMLFRTDVAWIDPTARSSHSGTQLAATISDFDTAVRLNRLDQLAAPTGSVSLNSQKLTNVLNGTNAQDAATWGQVQNLLNNTAWKDSVRVATTANITLSGLQTIDAITLVANDRVLVKNQTDPTQNGLYLAASGAWTRALDADGAGELKPGASVFVAEGATQADSQWRLTTDGTIVIGSTSIAFAQIGAATTYTPGTGISIGGNVVSVDTTIVARKFAANIGAGTSVAITHGLNTLDVIVNVYEIATGDTVECDIKRNTVNQVTLGFAVAVTADVYRVVVQG